MLYLYKRTDFCYSTDNNRTKNHIYKKYGDLCNSEVNLPCDKLIFIQVIQMYG